MDRVFLVYREDSLVKAFRNRVLAESYIESCIRTKYENYLAVFEEAENDIPFHYLHMDKRIYEFKLGRGIKHEAPYSYDQFKEDLAGFEKLQLIEVEVV